MERLNQILFFALIALTLSNVFAQTQRQGGGQGFNPGQMVAAEKKMVYDSINDLSADQKEVINMIYADYEESFGKVRAEANGDYEGMRDKMMAIRENKDKAMKEILTKDQYKEYTALLEKLRQRRRRN